VASVLWYVWDVVPSSGEAADDIRVTEPVHLKGALRWPPGPKGVLTSSRLPVHVHGDQEEDGVEDEEQDGAQQPGKRHERRRRRRRRRAHWEDQRDTSPELYLTFKNKAPVERT